MLSVEDLSLARLSGLVFVCYDIYLCTENGLKYGLQVEMRVKPFAEFELFL